MKSILLSVGLLNGLIIEFLIYVTVKLFDEICIVNMYSFNCFISSSMDVATTNYVPLRIILQWNWHLLSRTDGPGIQ